MSDSVNANAFYAMTRVKRQRRVVKLTTNRKRRRTPTNTHLDLIFGIDPDVPMLSMEDFNIERMPGKPLQ